MEDKNVDNILLSSDTRLIAHYCFSDCKTMKSITLPDDLVFLGDGAFYGCSSLSKITLPNEIKTIEGSLFSGCKNLDEIIIPSNVQSIREYAFDGCKSLTEIVIPKNVTGIYDNAFNGCESLVKIKFEDSSNGIELGTSGYSYKSLFKDCPLEDVYIGRNIGMYYSNGQSNDFLPFYNKNTIKSLTIGSEVTNVWNYSFYGCSALEDVYALGELPVSLDSYTFSNSIYSKCKLHVLPNSVSLYSTANVWRNFQNIVEIATSVETISIQPINDGIIYDLKGVIGSNTSGIKIIKTKDGIVRKIFMK